MHNPYYKHTLKNGEVIECRGPEYHDDGSATFYFELNGTYEHKSAEEMKKMRDRQLKAQKLVESEFGKE